MRRLLPILLALSFATCAKAAELDLTLATSAGRPVADAVVMVRPDAGARGAGRISGPFVMA